MDSVPIYVQIGAILGIVSGISGIVYVILHFAQLLGTIRSFLKWLYGWLKWRRVLFGQWRWWKQYRPSCEIVKTGKLRIAKPSNRYYMELRIEVRYTSRDNRHDTGIDITSVNLDVYNMGKGRDSKPYRLCRSSFTLQISPIEEDSDGGFLVIPDIWSLPSGGNVVVRYTFESFIDAPPLVGASTFCKIVAIGKARIEGVSGSRELKADDKFLVEVVKEYEN